MVDALVCGSLDSRRLRRRKRPVRHFNAERLCVLNAESLPAVEFHAFDAGDAADGRSAVRAANMPPGGTHWR